jgi:hypothetical protein
MLRDLVIMLGCISLAACTNSLGPNALTGVYDGRYTTTAQPYLAYQAEINIIQASDTVWGTLHTNSGRSANVYGPVLGSFLAMRILFNDTCGGSATFTMATITDGGRHLAGRFNVSGGCDGRYTALFSLTKQ